MNPATADPLYVFGLEWWPFDGAVTAAIIAGIVGVVSSVIHSRRQTKSEARQARERASLAESSEQFQRDLHDEVMKSAVRQSQTEHRLTDLRRAEDATIGDNPIAWILAATLCKEVAKDASSTRVERVRANTILAELMRREGRNPA